MGGSSPAQISIYMIVPELSFSLKSVLIPTLQIQPSSFLCLFPSFPPLPLHNLPPIIMSEVESYHTLI